MLKSFWQFLAVATIVVVGVMAAACGGDDDGDGGGAPAGTTPAIVPSGGTGSGTPTIAPDTSTYCSETVLATAVEDLFNSVKLMAEDRGLSVSDEDELRKDARETLNHLCAAPTPFEFPTLQRYCEDLIDAIENNVEGDDGTKAELKEFYRRASCPSPTPVP